MNTYIITYDLMAPGKDYNNLYTAIKSCGAWAKVVYSTWAIKTDLSAVQVRDYLIQHMDANDRLFVIKSGREAAWRGTICNGEWLQNNL